MKTLFLGSIFLMTTLSAFAGIPLSEDAITTTDYSVKYSSEYADSKGRDYICSYVTGDGIDPFTQRPYTYISMTPYGSGRYIQFEIPKDLLPLKEGMSYYYDARNSKVRITYSNGILSQEINNLEDAVNIFYKQNIGRIAVNPDLTNPKFIDVQEVGTRKNIFGFLKAYPLMSLQCRF